MTDPETFKKALQLHEAGKFGEAAALYRDILRADPTNVTVIHLLALVAMQFDNAALVLALADNGLQVAPDTPVLHQDRATALRRLGRKDEALASINRAIELNPDEADFYDTLAAIQRDLRQFDQAVATLKKASAMEPENPKFYNNLAICLGRMGANAEALAHLDTYIRLKPQDASGYNNKANVLKASRRYREAIAYYDKALAIDPNIFMGHANKGMAHLVLGEYAEGWKLFEDRKPGNMPPENTRFDRARRWDGKTAPDATLVLYNEQGMGDTVQFCRFVPMVLERVPNVILQAQAPLAGLMATNFPGVTIITPEDPLPAYDLQCPLMSLPHIFATTPETVPSAAGYLKADAAKIDEWRTKVPADGRKKIGIVWAGNPDHMNDHIRSVPLKLFEPLWAIPNLHFISLQKGDQAQAQIGQVPSHVPFTHLGDQLRDFSDTAALLQHIDLLISVDTSVLHVAGATGRPAWAMLQFDPDWRWMLERATTPWYDHVRLFRQKTYGNWADVTADIGRALTSF